MRRPAIVVQSDRFNQSRLRTVIVVAVTSNQRLAAMPGNVGLPAELTGLAEDSVVNVTQVATVDRADLIEQIGTLPPALLEQIDGGLALVLST
ncbi:MAG: type II toxin-antitoxin system PemK/MazF family toxin [Iamia sp.]